MEDKRKSLLREIDKTSTLLDKTKATKAANLNRYLALQSQIKKRHQVIRTLQDEIEHAEAGIQRAQEVTAALSGDIERLRKDYAALLRRAHRMRQNQSNLLFLFSSTSLNDAFQRWQYLRQYERYRRRQATLIEETRVALNERTAQLEQRIKEKQRLLGTQQQQEELLDQEMADKDRTIQVLKKDESKLAAQLEKQQKSHQKLNDAIEWVIREEVTKKKQAARNPETLKSFSAKNAAEETQEDIISPFSKSKGKLPWPVSGGSIVRKFGQQPHPTLKNVQITNNGIDIRAGSRAAVSVVFEGKVVGIQFIPGYKNTVVVQHERYYTVYSNLQEVSVSKGDNVSAGQTIGSLSSEVPELHFEVWQEKKRLNPASWIR
ncbi:MAG: peptidoglycan DD-metalloendopeptidase family protein [Saprospiraceae bacterium]|nr:peptidoglycan DD-metalloendopeptidase family protein [Saprospiraceae bacterium]